MNDTDRHQQDLSGEHAGHAGHRWMMVACCIPMLAVAIALVATGVVGAGFILVALACTAMMAMMMGGSHRTQPRLLTAGRQTMSTTARIAGTRQPRRPPHPAPRSVKTGLVAGLALGLAYAAIVAGASRSLGHLADQVRADWYFLVPLMAGFGVQVGLMAELRRRHRLMAGAATAGVAGAGASTAGMIACCAHHIADLAPVLGTSAAATFLTAYKLPFVVVGLGLNAAGIVITARRLRQTPVPEGTAGAG